MLDIKEKKRKGLFYLIITISIIAAIVISCSDKPTASNDFAGFDDSVTVSSTNVTSEDFKTFIGKTIRSREAISKDGIVGYFWAEFNNGGIKYGQGDELNKGGLPHNAQLNTSAFTNSRANFSDNNGYVEFQLGGSTITNIQICLTNSSFQMRTNIFDCQFVQ